MPADRVFWANPPIATFHQFLGIAAIPRADALGFLRPPKVVWKRPTRRLERAAWSGESKVIIPNESPVEMKFAVAVLGNGIPA